MRSLWKAGDCASCCTMIFWAKYERIRCMMTMLGKIGARRRGDAERDREECGDREE